jgi:hypothetical protein
MIHNGAKEGSYGRRDKRQWVAAKMLSIVKRDPDVPGKRKRTDEKGFFPRGPPGRDQIQKASLVLFERSHPHDW